MEIAYEKIKRLSKAIKIGWIDTIGILKITFLNFQQ